jgi:hypothetical protein
VSQTKETSKRRDLSLRNRSMLDRNQPHQHNLFMFPMPPLATLPPHIHAHRQVKAPGGMRTLWRHRRRRFAVVVTLLTLIPTQSSALLQRILLCLSPPIASPSIQATKEASPHPHSGTGSVQTLSSCTRS